MAYTEHQVELARMWEDGTWDTEIINLPPQFQNRINEDMVADINVWANGTLSELTKYRKVVQFVVSGFTDTIEET